MNKWVITIIKFVLFLGLGIFIAYISIHNLTPEQTAEIMQSFRNANYTWVLISIAVGILSHVMRTLRWQLLLETVGEKPSFRNTMIAVMIGYFANMAFPRLGEVTRCGILHNSDRIPVNKSLGTVITERVIDLVTFLILMGVVFVTQFDVLNSFFSEKIFPQFDQKFGLGASVLLFYIAGTAILVLSIFIFCVVKYTGPKQRILFRLRKIIIGFWQGLISVARLRRPWLFVGYSVAIWFMYLLATYFCFLSLPATSLLEIDIALAVLVTGSVGIMVTPGGIGLYPIIVRDTLILYGIAATSGFAVGWITWSAQTIMIIIVGTGSLVWLSFIKKKVPLKSNIIRNLERDNDA